jgi:hypothetical protein
MIILVQYASRSRPERFAEGLRSLIENAAEPEKLIIHIVLDEDDPLLLTYFNNADTGSEVGTDWNPGISTSKINAINRPFAWVEEFPWDILLNWSDDMRMTYYGWDVLIREAFREEGTLDRFIHFPDREAKDRVSIMSVMGREYYLRDGYIYNPEYLSLFADNEATDVARLRGCYKFVDTEIFIHDNGSSNGTGYVDEMQREQQKQGYEFDHKTFLRRQTDNFGL